MYSRRKYFTNWCPYIQLKITCHENGPAYHFTSTLRVYCWNSYLVEGKGHVDYAIAFDAIAWRVGKHNLSHGKCMGNVPKTVDGVEKLYSALSCLRQKWGVFHRSNSIYWSILRDITTILVYTCAAVLSRPHGWGIINPISTGGHVYSEFFSASDRRITLASPMNLLQKSLIV